MLIYDMLISPLELIINWTYVFIENTFPLLGAFGNLYFVSVVVNLLSLPLYNKAEVIQKKEREVTKYLEPSVKHIKKTFRGNEQFMMLQSLYKENNYHPLYALRGSLSILIEIPIFIAAYKYLSNILPFDRDYFLLLKDASLPDGLITFSILGRILKINILPIIMTLINYVSGFIYTRNSTKREKIQVYMLGAIFLILLYNSPSGLVFYWILNNLFSLGKNIAENTNHTREILGIYIGINVTAYGVLALVFAYRNVKNIFILIIGLLIIVCSVTFLFDGINRRVVDLDGAIKKNKFGFNLQKIISKLDNLIDKSNSGNQLLLMFISGAGLTLLLGLVLPSNVIVSSPEEFSFIGNTASPLSYIKTTFFVFLGCFVVWPFLIYKMSEKKTRFYEGIILFVSFISLLFNSFLFQGKYGFLTRQFYLEDETLFNRVPFTYQFFPIFITIVLIFLFILMIRKDKLFNIVMFVCIALCIAECCISLKNIINIKKRFNEYSKIVNDKGKEDTITPILHLSKTGKNIITIFSDRAPSSFFIRVLDEDDNLQDQFKGFTYFPNTVSLGAMTIVGVPSMLGGYEYSPYELNKRASESHLSKYNEANFVLPRFMLNNNYDVTILDPPLPNLTQKGDLSAYKNEFGNSITIKELEGKYTEKYLNEKRLNTKNNSDRVAKKEIQNFVVLEILYPNMRKWFNTKFRSKYFNSLENFSSGSLDVDDLTFLDSYSTLYYLNDLTTFDGENDQYIFLGTNITHNEAYLNASLEQPTDINNKVKLKYETGINRIDKNYHSYLALMKSLGKFFDELRENEVYDNTRIIITSDHGLQREIPPLDATQSTFNPILLYKDFNQRDVIKIDNTFMTSADAPLLAVEGVDNRPINPYTKKPLKGDKSHGVNVYYAHPMDVNGAPFRDGKKKTLNLSQGGYKVHDDLFNKSNWIKL